jgi:GT2 family glycosyltransferase
MELRPEHITIAVTVFSRRQFVVGAIQSALTQTVPVKVIVVEDCGPDPDLQKFIVGEFGSRIEYFRNPHNRGLFDNWNACMEYCRTPWISILHDDDLLHPWWAETLLQLAQEAPRRMLYFGHCGELDDRGHTHPARPVNWGKGWRETDLVEFAKVCLVLFPGQLFQIADARAVGGVGPNSYFTGDWDLWFRLAMRGGAAQSAREVSIVRSHGGAERGSSRVDRMGWKWALDNVQRKRNLARLRKEKGIQIPFNRKELVSYNPVPTRGMLRHAHGFSRRVLAYNAWLFLQSPPPHLPAAVLMWLVRRMGPEVLRRISACCKAAHLDKAL